MPLFFILQWYIKSDIAVRVSGTQEPLPVATPKDGPSAGIGMCVALLSAITGIPVKSEVAMTGEITLRGRVLPVGGVKEKVLAAHRAGIKRVILPERNTADLDEVPEEVRETLEFVPVSKMDAVLANALLDPDRRTGDQIGNQAESDWRLAPLSRWWVAGHHRKVF